MTHKIPVHLGDLGGSAGNVFAVVASCKRSIKEFDRSGIDVSDEARAVVGEFMTRSYEETLTLIEEHFEDLDHSIAQYREYEWSDDD